MNEKDIRGNFLSAYVHIEDTQDIQVLQDECYQISHCLNLDSTILQRLMALADEKVQDIECRPEDSGEYLQDIATELELERKRVDSVLRRLDATIALVRMLR